MNTRPPARAGLARALTGVLILILAFLAYGAAARFLRADGQGDFPVFHDAFRAVLDGADLYASGRGGYIYPPLFAVVFAPLGLLSQGHAAVVWTLLNAGLIFACLWVTADEITRRFDAKVDKAVVPAVMLITFAVFADKLRSELRLGQTDMLVMLGMMLSLRWLDRRPILSGIVLGFIGHIKYQSLVVLPYLLIRRRWHALTSTIVSAAAFALSTAAVFGWQRNVEYLSRGVGGLGRLFGEPAVEDAANILSITWIRSISLTSTIARFQEWAALPAWTLPAMVLVAAGAALAAVLMLYKARGCSLFLRRDRTHDAASPRARALAAIEWTGMITAVLVFGPQTTARHMVLLVPLVSLAAMLLVVPKPGIRRLPILAATVFLLLAFILPPGSGVDAPALHAWRAVGGISIATLALLYITIAGALRWAESMPDTASATP